MKEPDAGAIAFQSTLRIDSLRPTPKRRRSICPATAVSSNHRTDSPTFRRSYSPIGIFHHSAESNLTRRIQPITIITRRSETRRPRQTDQKMQCTCRQQFEFIRTLAERIVCATLPSRRRGSIRNNPVTFPNQARFLLYRK